tara:strand:- start:802 stop:1044 length:243 start_codon:yes stop_codon:yes gene_type:complete
MTNTKAEFIRATRKTKGFKTWFTEPIEDDDGYTIEIWLNEGYTIGDNDQTGERINVYLEEMTVGQGWHKAIQALKTISLK